TGHRHDTAATVVDLDIGSGRIAVDRHVGMATTHDRRAAREGRDDEEAQHQGYRSRRYHRTRRQAGSTRFAPNGTGQVDRISPPDGQEEVAPASGTSETEQGRAEGQLKD